jgi:hypothetical protein
MAAVKMFHAAASTNPSRTFSARTVLCGAALVLAVASLAAVPLTFALDWSVPVAIYGLLGSLTVSTFLSILMVRPLVELADGRMTIRPSPLARDVRTVPYQDIVGVENVHVGSVKLLVKDGETVQEIRLPVDQLAQFEVEEILDQVHACIERSNGRPSPIRPSSIVTHDSQAA